MGASHRFGNPVVSVSNIKYIVVIEQVATFGFTKMNFKFRFFQATNNRNIVKKRTLITKTFLLNLKKTFDYLKFKLLSQKQMGLIVVYLGPCYISYIVFLPVTAVDYNLWIRLVLINNRSITRIQEHSSIQGIL
jgi:hypothetical protein